MKTILVLLALLLAAGCGPRYIWVKNVGQDELNRDRYECERDARMSAGSFGAGFVGASNAQEFIGRCFQSKGYVLQAVNAPSTVPVQQVPHSSDATRHDCEDACRALGAGEECEANCRRNHQ